MPGPAMGLIEYLERIAALRDSGALDDDEYATLKQKVLRPKPSHEEHADGYL